MKRVDCQNLFKSVYPYMVKTPKIVYEILAAQKFKKSKTLQKINKDVMRIILKKYINNYIDFTYELIVKKYNLYNENRIMRKEGLKSFSVELFASKFLS